MIFFRKSKDIKQNRIKARSVTASNLQNKKRIKLFLKIGIISLMSFLLWYGLYHTRPSSFPVKSVKIFATYEHVDQGALRKIVAPYLDNGFFYLNVFWMKQQLLNHPWIYAVSVKREWPDTVIINIVEQYALLQWGMKALINSEGTIFTPLASTFPQGLPIIFGPEKREPEIFTLYQKTLLLFEPLDLTVKQLIFNPHHYWEIMFSNGMAVYLKEDEPLKQLELLAKLYKKITAKRSGSPKAVDLRYQTGLAVKWE